MGASLRRRALRQLGWLAPSLLWMLLLLPVLGGLAGTLLPALGFGPGAGPDTGPASAALALLARPGIGRSTMLSLLTGLGASVLALAIAAITVGTFLDRRGFGLVRRLLSPLLAVPHAAAAFGVAALIAPSGLVARALSPWFTGWDRPPDLLVVNDGNGVALLLGLAAKEAPFLVLMLIAALPQVDAGRRMLVARSLGHGRAPAFLLTVWPALYPQIRLAVLAVVVYGVSNVDMAMILGPTTPPTLAVVTLKLATDADLALRGQAAA